MIKAVPKCQIPAQARFSIITQPGFTPGINIVEHRKQKNNRLGN